MATVVKKEEKAKIVEGRQDTFSCIYERRSTRNFEKGAVIPEEAMGKILDSARYAPPTPDGNFPWRFLVAREQATKTLYADCAIEIAKVVFGGSFQTFDRHLWYMPDDTRPRIAEYTISGELWRYPENCGVLTIPLLSKGGEAGYSQLLQRDEPLSLYLGMAVQNTWLMASLYGIGAGYNAMANNDGRRRETVCSYLGIPRLWRPSGAYSFGITPASRASGPSRGTLEAIAFSEYWGNPYERLAFRGATEGIELPKSNIIDTIKNERIVSSFKPGKVDDWMIERILDVAMWGPYPENFKPYRYLIVRSDEAKEFLYDQIKEIKHTAWYSLYHERNLSRYWYVKEQERLAKYEEELERGLGAWIPEADTVIVITNNQGWADGSGGPTTAAGSAYGWEATGCAIQNMMLAATALGLGANFDPTISHDYRTCHLTKDYFGMPSSTIVMGILGLGKPGKKEERAPLTPFERLFYDEYFGIPLQNKYSL